MFYQFLFVLIVLTKSQRKIFTERRANYNLNGSHSIQTGSTGESADNYGVCLFCQTRLLVRQWNSVSWAKKFFSYLNKILIPSILRQCEFHSSCPSLRSLYLLIKVDVHHNELDKFIWEAGRKINIRVFSKERDYSAIIQKIVDQDDCKWLSSVYMDADDSFLDGYFDYVLTELIRKLDQTLTMDGLPWRGAVFGARSLSHLIIGKGRCATEDIDEHWYSGHSQGQGFHLRRDVWEEIGRLSQIRGLHTQFLRKVRNSIMMGLGFKEYQSQSCQGWFRFWNNTDRQIAFEKKDAAASRIMFIDMSLVKSTAAMFIVTPFSSHFPWNAWQNLPVCRDEEKKVIQGKFPRSIEYILNTVNSDDLNISLEEACRSNIFFSKSPDCSKVANGA